VIFTLLAYSFFTKRQLILKYPVLRSISVTMPPVLLAVPFSALLASFTSSALLVT